MTNPGSLVGMFFLRDNGDTYLTGEIVGQVGKNAYLLKPDNMNSLPAEPPHELMGLGDMTRMNDYGAPIMSLFPTRENLSSWLDWVERPDIDPTGAKIINLVKK